jgi:hypothetical protein
MTHLARLSAALLIAVALGGSAVAGDYFVDLGAPANGNGSAGAPFQSLPQAMAALRRKADRGQLRAPTVLHVGPGDYVLSSDLRLDVPNLTVCGTLNLTRDARGLATGASGPRTRIAASVYLQQLVTIAAENVTLSNLYLDGDQSAIYGDGATVTLTVFVDGTQVRDADGGFGIRHFRLANLWAVTAEYGILTRAASGVVEGCLFGGAADFSLANHFGAAIAAGTRERPAFVEFRANRSTGNGAFGATFMGDLARVPDPQPGTFDGALFADVHDNDCSGNGALGLCLVYRENSFFFTLEPTGSAGLAASVHDNTLNDNGLYGLVIHAPQGAFGFGECPGDTPGTLDALLLRNVMTGNGVNQALFSFRAFISAYLVRGECDDCVSCYVQQSSMNVWTGWGEEIGFDYDLPAGLGDVLRVDGAELPPMVRITGGQ